MKNFMPIIATLGIFTNTFYSQEIMDVRQLTFDDTREGFPSWSPDGKYIIYQSTDMNDTTGKNGLWKISLDGTGAEQVFSGVAEHPTGSQRRIRLVSGWRENSIQQFHIMECRYLDKGC